MLPFRQGPGGSSELGEWKVEAHGNVLDPTSRDTRCVPFRSLSQVSPRVLKARSGFEVNLTELHFFPWGVNGICMEMHGTKQICTYLHMCDKFAHNFAEAQEPEALNAPVAEPFPTATDHAERSAASARGVQGGGQGSASCVSHEAKEPGPQLRYARYLNSSC